MPLLRRMKLSCFAQTSSHLLSVSMLSLTTKHNMRLTGDHQLVLFYYQVSRGTAWSSRFLQQRNYWRMCMKAETWAWMVTSINVPRPLLCKMWTRCGGYVHRRKCWFHRFYQFYTSTSLHYVFAMCLHRIIMTECSLVCIPSKSCISLITAEHHWWIPVRYAFPTLKQSSRLAFVQSRVLVF